MSPACLRTSTAEWTSGTTRLLFGIVLSWCYQCEKQRSIATVDAHVHKHVNLQLHSPPCTVAINTRDLHKFTVTRYNTSYVVKVHVTVINSLGLKSCYSVFVTQSNTEQQQHNVWGNKFKFILRIYYTEWPRKVSHKLLSISLPNIDRCLSVCSTRQSWSQYSVRRHRKYLFQSYIEIEA